MLRERILLLVVIFTLFLGGCASSEPVQTQPDALTPLVIGVMPAVDAAPIFLADQEGYFSELGLDVEVQVFTNAQDRQSALQTGAIDGAMSDMIALITNVQGGFDIKGTTMTDGVFPVLVRKGFEEQKAIRVAMMEVSVSNYLADEWLGTKYDVEKIFINEIPARLEMIKNNQVDMGIFPEPMATMGALDGLEKVIYETKDSFCPDVFVFTSKAISEKTASVEAFHRAYDKAVDAILKDEALARDVLVETLKLKPEIRDQIHLPVYNTARLPDDAYVEQMMAWVASVLKKELDIEAQDVFDRAFVKP